MTRKNLFIAVLVFQVLAVFGLAVPYLWLLTMGTTVMLRTVPVDPRSIFRGDYVILDYEIGAALPQDWMSSDVYVVLKKNGDIDERVRFSEEKPLLEVGQTCIRGVNQNGRASFPDIAQYFVEEGLGHELEQAESERRLIVEAVVDASCTATLRRVWLEPEGMKDVPASPALKPATK